MKLYTVIISVWPTKYHNTPDKYKIEVIARDNVSALHTEINHYLVTKLDIYSWELNEVVKEHEINAGVVSLYLIPE